MAKMYIVNLGEGRAVGVTTIKAVSELLSRRVSKKDIEESLVPEVEFVDKDLTEDMLADLEENGQIEFDVEVYDTDEYDDDGEDDSDDIEDDIEEEEILEEEEDLEEDLEDGTEDDTETSEDDDTEEDEEESANEPPTMDELLAKLRANNEKLAKDNPAPEGKKKSKGKVELLTDDEGGYMYPEKGYFKDEDHIKKYYKQLEDEHLLEWLELEGLEYTANEHAGINRMRMCMAIKDYHFPKETKGKKSKSKYADLSTEELLQMALDNDLEVKDAKGDMKILRMYTIMALRDAKILG